MVRLLISILTVVGLSACEMVPKASLDEALVRHADELDALTAYQISLEQEVERLGAEVASLGVSLDERRAFDAREASAEIDRATQELREAMAGLVRSGDVEFLDGPEGPVLRIRNQVLFASGSASVSRKGHGILEAVAQEIVDIGHAVEVVGHTDNQPVKVRAAEFPRGNLQLSARRAVEVASLLIESGVPAETVSVGGRGSWNPISSNDDDDGRARNRRVELIIRTLPVAAAGD